MQVRKFGKDLSNTKSSNKTPNTKQNASSSTTTPSTNNKSITEKRFSQTPSTTLSFQRPSFQTPISNKTISKSLNSTPSSTQKIQAAGWTKKINFDQTTTSSSSPLTIHTDSFNSRFQYDCDFLLQFKQDFTSPIPDGLAQFPDIFRPFSQQQTLQQQQQQSTQTTTIQQPQPSIQTFISTPKRSGSVGTLEADTPRSSSSVSSSDEMGANLSTPAAASFSPSLLSSSAKKSATKRSAKKMQESDSARLAARQKQIDIGKNTVGYKVFVEAESDDRKAKGNPKTPNKFQMCSKRSWDGQVRKWRRLLHQFDPEGLEMEMEPQSMEKPKISRKLFGENSQSTTTAKDLNLEEEDDEEEGEEEDSNSEQDEVLEVDQELVSQVSQL